MTNDVLQMTKPPIVAKGHQKSDNWDDEAHDDEVLWRQFALNSPLLASFLHSEQQAITIATRSTGTWCAGAVWLSITHASPMIHAGKKHNLLLDVPTK